MHIASLGLKMCIAPPERELMSMPRKTPVPVPVRARKSPLRVAAGSLEFAPAGQPAAAAGGTLKLIADFGDEQLKIA
jgi:hypothetical protein